MATNLRGDAFWARLCIALVALSLTVCLANRGLALRLFNLAGLVALAGIGVYAWRERCQRWQARPVAWPLVMLLLSMLLLGASKLGWALYYGVPGEDHANNNQEGGERILLATLLLGYLYSQRQHISQACLRWMALVLYAGLVYLLFKGLREVYGSSARLRLNTDAATTAAYILVGYGLTTTILIRRGFIAVLPAALLSLSSMAMTFALLAITDTRSAVLLVPWLFLLVAVADLARASRAAKLGAMAALALCAACAVYANWHRIASINTELANYTTDNNTSIGARITLYKTGLYAQRPTMLGQPVDTRYAQMKQYIELHEQGNPEALFSINYHLHNEILEALTLRGIVAAMIQVGFYLALLVMATRQRSTALLAFTVGLVILGFADVVLYQRLACLALFSCVVLLVVTHRATHEEPPTRL